MGKGLGNLGWLDEVGAREERDAILGEDVDMRKDLLAWAAEADALGIRFGSGGVAHAENVPVPVLSEVRNFAGAVLDMMSGYTDGEIETFTRDLDPEDEDAETEAKFIKARLRSRFVQAVENTRRRLVTALGEIGYDGVNFNGLEGMETRVYLDEDTVDVRFFRKSMEEAVSEIIPPAAVSWDEKVPSSGGFSVAKNVTAARDAMMPQAEDGDWDGNSDEA